MPELYWYISVPKIEILKGGLRRSHLTELSVKLKTMWFEVGASVDPQSSFVRDVQRVTKVIESDADVPSFHLLAETDSPPIFSFEGTGARLIDNGAYWFATERDSSALLLVGSAGNAVGGTPHSEGRLSPSVDPIGAVRAAFAGNEGRGAGLKLPLSYAWSVIMDAAKRDALHLPRVQGLAVFAGICPAEQSQVEQLDTHITRLVIGSPIFIRQI